MIESSVDNENLNTACVDNEMQITLKGQFLNISGERTMISIHVQRRESVTTNEHTSTYEVQWVGKSGFR